MSYSADQAASYKRVAIYVDKILKGAKPADLPVEQPTEVRVGHQSENSKADRPDNPTKRAGAGGQGHQVNFGFAILDFGLRRKAVRKIIRSESLSVNNLKSKIQNLKWVGIFAIAFTFAFGGAGASGAADRKNLPHRFPGSKHCFR